ncbi:MAG: hypothetical protein AB7F98_13250 [Novosphingobium sp.]
MFGWLKKRTKTLYPEARWQVVIDADTIRVIDADGNDRSVSKADISGVAIETNDSGPWGADVWWLIFGCDDSLACAYPQGATGEQAALDYLMALTGFDHSEMIKGMSSVENAVFPVWRKPD